MTRASNRKLREAIPALIVAAVTGLVTGGASFHFFMGETARTLSEHERRINQIEANERETAALLREIHANLSWVRGVLEGQKREGER